MKSARVRALMLIVAFGMWSSASHVGVSAQQPANQLQGISSEALAQIDALLAEKAARSQTQQKIDSQLLFEQRMESGQPIANGIWALETDLPYAADGHVVVDVHTRPGGVAARLAAAGIEVESASADGSALRAHINIDQVETLAADPDIVFIQAMQGAMTVGQEAVPNLVAPTGQGSRSSEGDVTHLAFAARGAFHIDGTGVKIGVLSDGVRNLAASQARGDLGPVTVIGPAAPCPVANTCDEGTAMLEIIHDLAPGAELFFASAFVNILSFADNIRALRAAGCDIIVDDVFYFVETPFQDGQPAPTNTNGGVVIQAVKDVTASGALYFSSAGNSGNLDAGTAGVWEGDFVDGGPTAAPLAAARVHSFGAQNFNTLTLANTNAPISLYWSDPLGASSNDYDLFRLNAAGTAIAAASANIQNGTQDPIEQISQSAANPRIVVVKKNAAEPRFLHLNTNRGRLAIATSGTIHGHAAVKSDGAYGVAATPAGAAFPQAFSAVNVVETFSSDGPRHIFYEGNGIAITPGNVLSTGGQVLQKPDITAADGVSVTGVGGFPSPFFGTSAAAPHAAAIAALIKSANSALAPAEMRSILVATAIDIQAAGVDRDSGAGIITARGAVTATGATGTAFVQVESLQVAENPGNADGVLEAGEGARMTVTLKNYGMAPATGIAALIASATSGVTLGLPNTRSYPDLMPLASAASAAILFTTATDVGCPAVANFNISATYSGGGAIAQSVGIPIGARAFTVTRALDGTTPPASPGVTTSTGLQVGRLFRDGVVSACGAQKVINTGGAANPVDAAVRPFEAYQFGSCSYSTPACATVTFQGANAINMFAAAYAPTFNPNNILENYKGDPGTSAASRTFSIDVGGGGDTFAIDVHDVPVANPPSVNPAPSGSVYTLTVAGICNGTCAPLNHPPLARAKNVTVAANNTMCVAEASIDDGSSDADGDALTFTQAPPSPYALGTTLVRLTVTDPKGAFSQGTGNVTVVDRTPPAIAGLSLTRTQLLPKIKKLVDYTVNYNATDVCGATTTSLSVTFANPGKGRDDDDNGKPGKGEDKRDRDDDGDRDDKKIDFIIVDNHHVRLRVDNSGPQGRIYTITVTAVDAAGNTSSSRVTVRTKDRDD
jgi:subtilase family protein